jgi:hypothetical protein
VAVLTKRYSLFRGINVRTFQNHIITNYLFILLITIHHIIILTLLSVIDLRLQGESLHPHLQITTHCSDFPS